MQNGPDPRQHLGEIERLGDIVVHSQLQALDAIGYLVHGREHDDGHVAVRCVLRGVLDPAGDLPAGQPRHQVVEHDEIGVHRRQLRERLPAVRGPGDFEAEPRQHHLEQLKVDGLVVDDEYPGVRGSIRHGCDRGTGCDLPTVGWPCQRRERRPDAARCTPPATSKARPATSAATPNQSPQRV